MGPLEGPYKREEVEQYLTRDLRGLEVGPYLVAKKSRKSALMRPYLVTRRFRKSALMGPLEGPIGGLNRDPQCLYSWDSS
jgi:hypothetical protein